MSILFSLGGEVSEGTVEGAAKRGTVDKVDRSSIATTEAPFNKFEGERLPLDTPQKGVGTWQQHPTNKFL